MTPILGYPSCVAQYTIRTSATIRTRYLFIELTDRHPSLESTCGCLADSAIAHQRHERQYHQSLAAAHQCSAAAHTLASCHVGQPPQILLLGSAAMCTWVDRRHTVSTRAVSNLRWHAPNGVHVGTDCTRRINQDTLSSCMLLHVSPNYNCRPSRCILDSTATANDNMRLMTHVETD